jgi:UPF0755 protein
MTDYGRGSGSDPWHPDDPLFGDTYDRGQGYPQQAGQQPQQYGGDWQDPYASGQHQQQYPQGGATGGTGQYPQAPYGQQGQQGQQGYQGQDPYSSGQHQQQYPQGGGYQGYDGYDTGGHRTFDTGSHPTGGYGQQAPYGQQHPGGYGGQQQGGYGDQYAQGGGYPQQQQPQQQPQPQQPQYGQQQAGRPVGAQGRPPQPAPGAGHPQEPAARPLRGAPEGTGDWGGDEDDNPREHAFFANRDDDDDDDDDVPAGRTRRSGRPQQGGKKRRSGCACFVVAAVLLGGLGGGVYFGYGVYQDHFGPAPDYSGQGSGSIQVTIPKGATLTVMGNLLKDAGVVKSVDAFTAAAGKNPKGQSIQAGVYVLRKQMSAAAAVTMMLDPKSQNVMIVAPGMRDKQIYALLDQKLGLKAGTSEDVAHAQYKTMGLPDWAVSGHHVKDPLEGFLYPGSYSAAKGMKPEGLLKEMVGRAKTEFAQFDLDAEAKKLKLDGPWQLLTVASLVQAEGKTDDDFRKMAKVIYNRLKPDNKQQTNGLLQFDSTYNYIKNSSQTKISIKEIQSLKDPYNTYINKGLPPGPIGNPGDAALKAVMDPDPEDWYFFVTKDGETTQYFKTADAFNKAND